MGPVVCMVTGSADGGTGASVLAAVAAAIASGVHLVQVRQPGLEGKPLLRLVEECMALTRGSRTRVIVNDRLDVALAAGAHGVHLRTQSVSALRARDIVPDGFLIGRSVHDPEEARQVSRAGGLDYLIAGTIFPTASKPGAAGLGLDGLRAIVSAASLPVLAIGGVTLESVGSVLATGAAGFAAISLFTRGMPIHFDTPDPVP